MDKAVVKEQAKEILDKFAKALEKVKVVSSAFKDAEGHEDFYVNREEFEREEKVSSISKDIEEKGDKCESFKEKLLKNAPKKDKDFVVAEKGSWK